MADLWWFVIGLGFMVVELMGPGFFLIFFSIGALLTALLSYLGAISALNTQLLVFLTTSIASLLLLRRWLRRTLQGRVTEAEASEEALDDFAGKKAKVVVAISPDTGEGRVEYRGTQWTATAEEPISEGKTVLILAKENLTLRVKPTDK